MKRLALLLVLLAGPAWAGDIRPFQAGSWKTLLAQHPGRPLVVHFWSLGCAPCVAEMHEWAKVAKAGRADLVLVSTDPIEDAPKLKAMLRRHGLGEVEAWAFADPFTEKLRFEIDRRWRGELPMTRLVLPSGEAESVVGSLDSGLAERLAALEANR